jgi:predicted nucleic acid-binding protein
LKTTVSREGSALADKPILFDSGPLGGIAHPKPQPEFFEWFVDQLKRGKQFIVPEICDYKVRRNFILESKKNPSFHTSIKRLDDLKSLVRYLPLTTDVMMKAAALWAEARRRGKSTGDKKELDGDVILAAQALSVNGIVATENISHLSLFVEAKHWRDIH